MTRSLRRTLVRAARYLGLASLFASAAFGFVFFWAEWWALWAGATLVFATAWALIAVCDRELSRLPVCQHVLWSVIENYGDAHWNGKGVLVETVKIQCGHCGLVKLSGLVRLGRAHE